MNNLNKDGVLGENKARTWADMAVMIGGEAAHERMQEYWSFIGVYLFVYLLYTPYTISSLYDI